MKGMEIFFFQVSLVLYLSASAVFITDLYIKRKSFENLPLWKSRIAFLFHLASVVIRAVRAGHLPVASLFESISFLSLIIVFFYLISVHIKREYKSLGAFILPIVFLINLPALALSKDVVPLVPALQSIWFYVHVPLCFLGYGSLTMAFCGAIVYFIQEKNLKNKNMSLAFRRLPSLMDADELCYKMVTAGFPFLTLGIITGAIWAQSAWGSYWSWDPKEVWSLITWLIYAIYLHTRLIGGWQGRKTNMVIIIGFICIIITFFGVNYILGGMHTYIH